MSKMQINDLVRRGEYRRAISLLEAALRRSPQDLDLIALMSFVLFRANELVRAEHFARRTLERLPNHPHANHNLGNILLRLGRFDEALPLLTRALELAPGEPEIRIALGTTLSSLNRPAAAVKVFEEGLSLRPGHEGFRINLAHALHAMGHIDRALTILREALPSHKNDAAFLDAWCGVLNYAPGVTAAEQFEAHRAWGQLVEAAVPRERPALRAELREGERLHIGLLSSDLRDHAVGYLVEDLLEHADRDRVKISCYAGQAPEDEMMRRLRKLADGWTSLANMTYADAAALIRRDGVHCLIDLAGHTKGQMLQVFAHRAAPVQATYTGYPNTTGLKDCDYRIVDSMTDPPGTECFSTEKLLYLDPCYMSYRPPADLPPVKAREPGAPLTFGCFGSLLKYNDALIATWSRVLKETPGSRMVLMHTALRDEDVREDVKRRFERNGVDPSRIEPREPVKGRVGVLKAAGEIDVALDTFPYNGAVTIVESLLMGVPYVSRAGETPASRAGLSILSAVGLSDLCARDEEGFVRTAVELAKDGARRAHLREALRDKVLASSICRGKAFAERFESALRSVLSSQPFGAPGVWSGL
jgi:protein O-GlcNAc transferase